MDFRVRSLTQKSKPGDFLVGWALRSQVRPAGPQALMSGDVMVMVVIMMAVQESMRKCM